MRGAALAAALLLAPPAAAGKHPYLVRAFPGVSTAAGSGDREGGRSPAFWLPSSSPDPGGGAPVPHALRLLPDGHVTDWTLDTPLAAPPAALRKSPTGLVWVLVPLVADGQALLYALDPGTAKVQRYHVPFAATHMTIDSATGALWLTGAGEVGKLDGETLSSYQVAGAAGPSSRIDPAARRIWLALEGGGLTSLSVDNLERRTWSGFGDALGELAVDDAGVVWGQGAEGARLVSFDPAAGRKSAWPIPRTSGAWAGPGAGGHATVTLCSAGGPHVLQAEPASLPGAVVTTLDEPSHLFLSGASLRVAPGVLNAAVKTAEAAFVERVEYRETVSGLTLFRDEGRGATAMVWSDGAEVLAGGDPVQWWQPMDPTKAFATQAALPVVAEVRPSDPTNNFRTEVTLANVDADATVSLSLTTATETFTTELSLPAGATRYWPDAMAALRALGAAVPEGAYGTLAATFANGRGSLAARVYTLFGDDTVFPRGSTTGLGFPSIDPAARLFPGTAALNGLKSTADVRTNVAFANLCGTLPCAPVTLEARFSDDATGAPVGTRTVTVPPHGLVQLDAPLAGFGVSGESFSVRIDRVEGGSSAWDAYATVISASARDAAFERAAGTPDTGTLVVPVVTDAAGIGTRFRSECAITSSSAVPVVADVTFTSVPTGRSVSDVVALGAGAGVFWPNAVDHFRTLAPSSVAADDYGPLRVSFRGGGTGLATARTLASNGTGLGLSALDPFAERATARRRVVGLRHGAAVRSNLAVVHLGATTADPAATITLRVSVTDASGSAVGEPLVATLSPGQLVQWTKVLELLGVQGDGFVATIDRTAGADAFAAYATIIDAVSADPTYLSGD